MQTNVANCLRLAQEAAEALCANSSLELNQFSFNWSKSDNRKTSRNAAHFVIQTAPFYALI